MGTKPVGIRPYQSRTPVKDGLVSEKGVILVELLVSLALILMVLGLALNMLAALQTGSRQQSNDAELLYSARVVREVIQNEVRNALDVEIVNGGSMLRITDTQSGAIGYYSANGNFYRDYKAKNPIAENVEAVCFSESDGCLLVSLDLRKGQDRLQLDFVCAQRSEAAI